MTQQQPLVHIPGHGGIWRRYLLDGPGRAINAAPWLDALARSEPVGTCPKDGGYLFPNGPPYRQGTRQWYPAACRSCKIEMAAPGPAQSKKRKRPA